MLRITLDIMRIPPYIDKFRSDTILPTLNARFV